MPDLPPPADGPAVPAPAGGHRPTRARPRQRLRTVLRTGVLRGAVLSVVALLALHLAALPGAVDGGTDAAGAPAVPVAASAQDGDGAWVGSWGAATSHAGSLQPQNIRGGGQTVRMAVLPSTGGDRARIRLSNTFNTAPVKVGHATLAHQKGLSAAEGKPVSLLFEGQQQVTLAPGETLTSDPLPFPVRGGVPLLVSLYFPDPLTTVAYHRYTLADSYSTAEKDGVDRAGAASPDTNRESADNLFPDKLPKAPWVLLTGVDVTPTEAHAGTVVAIGDSQTDAGHTEVNANHRWPDYAGRGLQQADHKPVRGMVNAGISGNRVLTPAGKGIVQRFDRDVLHLPGVSEVVLLGGINDITLAGTSEATLTQAVRDLAARAHQAGVSFTVATLPPFKGHKAYTAAHERTRVAFNQALRQLGQDGTVDRVLDLDQDLRDPADPRVLRAAYASSDHMHLNDAGTRRTAELYLQGTVTNTAPVDPASLTRVVVADVTGTGRADLLATVTGRDGLHLFAGRGDGTFGPGRTVFPTWPYRDTVAGDFDGDGRTDLVAHDTRAGRLLLWRGTGAGAFQAPVTLTGWKGFSQLTTGDVDADGAADLLAVKDATGDLTMWRGTKAGDSANPFGRPLALAYWRGITETTALDVNGDGKTDLVARSAAGDLKYWPSDGRHQGNPFGWSSTLTRWVGFRLTTGGDVDGDGVEDLVAVDGKNNQLKYWRSDGNPGTAGKPRNPFTRPKVIALELPVRH